LLLLFLLLVIDELEAVAIAHGDGVEEEVGCKNGPITSFDICGQKVVC
jgi:hypothetical protein